MCILNAVKCEMQKLLEKMFYTDEKLHIHCADSNPSEASAPEHLVLFILFACNCAFNWYNCPPLALVSPHILLLLLRCPNNVWGKRTIAVL